jgi:flavin reductase (DIM6/NTAB) family NADH-FMN oxidoreductase RutF
MVPVADSAGHAEASVRDLFSAYPSGLAAVGATIDGADVLMLVSSFTVGVSHDPPLCSVAIQKTSMTWPVLARAPRIGISVLSETHADSVKLLGSRDPRNRFRAVGLSRSTNESLVVEGSAAWFECRVLREVDAGDHVVVLLEVLAGSRAESASPLILHRGACHTVAAIAS